MDLFCTCGAQLPADARFCHKCGKPQYEEPLLEEKAPGPVQGPLEPALPAAPAPAEINFANMTAVRIALFAAVVAFIAISIFMPLFMPVIWLVVSLTGAGLLAVYLYRRRTGQILSVRSGARMGWITGIFCFAIGTVLFTASVISVSRHGGLAAFYHSQLKGRNEVNSEQVMQAIQTPIGLGGVLLFSLLLLFLLFTLLPMAGGALGAKLWKRNSAS